MRSLCGLVFAMVLLFAGTSSAVSPGSSAAPSDLGYVPGTQQLEGRLLAPCCYKQTLDIHSSPLAGELRHEIRTRLKAGESVDSIQASLVARYGDKILAVPKGSPLQGIALGLLALVVLGGVGADWLLVTWRRRSRGAHDEMKTSSDDRDEWDERLDTELERIEG